MPVGLLLDIKEFPALDELIGRGKEVSAAVAAGIEGLTSAEAAEVKSSKFESSGAWLRDSGTCSETPEPRSIVPSQPQPAASTPSNSSDIFPP